MGMCNFCTYNAMKRRAKEGGYRLVLIGNNVYSLQKGERLPKNITKEWEDKHFRAWFMELPSSCFC